MAIIRRFRRSFEKQKNKIEIKDMYDSNLTKVTKEELEEVLNEIIELSVNEELSNATLLQRQLKFYYQTRKELRDSCRFVNVTIQSGNYIFRNRLELMIDKLLYYVRDNQLDVCTFKEETMTIEKQYAFSHNAHPLLIKKWYDYLNRQHYFDSLKSFLSYYKFDEAND